ncbi:MAG TPA: DUF6364 family protein [Thermoleophilia bacterium]|nr:DUF6364 family protein [Thermoleophilia bacterium]HQG04265.1 DUF6364 family protein [Thermoleophilia bacterium]HQG55308.1 DUF6364 family protein [Thermoleophilia bacterium]HQJ98273.1 DUF6364 family protein [Thermoleophilia bacterium]
MDETKLTVRIPRETLDAAKRYAHDHGTTLTRLVVTYLDGLRRATDAGTDAALPDAPLTRRLAGSLPPEASPEDYLKHLERKYE